MQEAMSVQCTVLLKLVVKAQDSTSEHVTSLSVNRDPRQEEDAWHATVEL
jgi:hypothetical protein